MRSTVAAALLIVGSLALPATTSGQALGTVAGVVKDKSGAVLPGVTVEASQALIETVRTAVTDGTGQYEIVNMPPGVYSVTFSLSGFNMVKVDGVEVAANSTANVNADLKVGPVAETITISEIQRRRVICGLTLIPADPSVDPKMRGPMVQRDVKPLIETITPSICRDE